MKAKHKERPREQVAQPVPRATLPRDSQPLARARHPNKQQKNRANDRASQQEDRAARPPPGRNRSTFPPVTSSSSTYARAFSPADAAEIRYLVNNLPKKARELWNIIFQRNNTRGETVSMAEFERVGGLTVFEVLIPSICIRPSDTSRWRF